MKRVVIYVRVSTDEQAKHGYSIKAQVESLEAFAKSQGWEIVALFVDDGYSAKDLDRPKFKEMMETIKQQEIDVLLVHKLDRLTRSVLDLYEILKQLDENACCFKSATEVYDTTNAMGRLFITLVAAIAQWERENLAERIKFGQAKKAREGKFIGSISALGYEHSDKMLHIIEGEAQIVRKVFDMAVLMSPLMIARELTKRNVPTRKGGNWNKETIRSILVNPIYAGYIAYNDEGRNYKKTPKLEDLYEAVHEPIISREQFWSVQEVLKKRAKENSKTPELHYYFNGVLECARCGSSYTSHKQRDKKGYRCSGQRAGNNCDAKTFGEKYIVQSLFKTMHNFNILSVDSPVISTTQEANLEDYTKELKKIEVLKEKKKTLYENDFITMTELKEQTTQLVEREKELNELIKRITRPEEIERVNHIKQNFYTIWKYATEQEKKQIIQILFNRIVIDGEQINRAKNKVIIVHAE